MAVVIRVMVMGYMTVMVAMSGARLTVTSHALKMAIFIIASPVGMIFGAVITIVLKRIQRMTMVFVCRDSGKS